MKHKPLTLILFLAISISSQNIDLLWRARGLQALHNIDSLNNILKKKDLSSDLYAAVRCRIYIEKAYSLFATNYEENSDALRFNNYYHLLNYSYNDSITDMPLDVGFLYKDGIIMMTIFYLPNTWLATHVSDGIMFKPWKSKLIIYYKNSDPLNVEIFKSESDFGKKKGFAP